MSQQHHKEDGAVLLTTLLAMTFIAALAVSIVDDVVFTIKRSTAVDDAQQAAHYLDGAEAFALAALEQQIGELEPTAMNALLLSGQPIIFPIEDGTLAVTVTDGSNCLSPDMSNGDAPERFTRFLRLAGVEADAQALTLNLVDWQDADQGTSGGAEDGTYLNETPAYRTADSPIGAISEVRAVRGFTPEIYQAIAPWLCVKPGAPQSLNVNTLRPEEAPVLAAALNLDIASARGLLSQRPPEGWAAGAFSELLDEDAQALAGQIGDVPTVYRLNIRVDYRDAVRHAQLMVSGDGNLEVIHRARGEAALPPVLPQAESET